MKKQLVDRWALAQVDPVLELLEAHRLPPGPVGRPMVGMTPFFAQPKDVSRYWARGARNGPPLSVVGKNRRDHEQIEGILAQLQQQPFVKWLHKQPSFRQAWRRFGARRAKALRNDAVGTSQITQPRAPLQFHWIVVFYGKCYREYLGDGAPRKAPSSKKRDATVSAIDRLLGHLEDGVTLTDSNKQTQLMNCLMELKHECSLVGRKEREGKAADDRLFIQQISDELANSIGIASHVLLLDICQVVGVSGEESTLKTVVRQSKRPGVVYA